MKINKYDGMSKLPIGEWLRGGQAFFGATFSPADFRIARSHNMFTSQIRKWLRHEQVRQFFSQQPFTGWLPGCPQP